MKVAILFDNFGPYHIARLESAHHRLQNQKWKVIGIEISRSSLEYAWQSRIDQLRCKIYTVLSDHSSERGSFTKLIYNLYILLQQVSPDVVVIAGYDRLTMNFALLWSVINKKQAVLLSESKEDDALRKPIREKLKSLLIGKYSSALVGGNKHKQYLIKLGMPGEAIFLGYDVVNNEVFHPQRISHLPSHINACYFFAVNRFVQKKNLPRLIEAYAIHKGF